jgi:N,N'-diacetylchitobiose phosphorylase
MKYGYFDDRRREYVVTNPDTPMSWVNYLGTSEYCGIISNNGAGYAFKDSPKSGRFLRFRFNSVPADRPGRYVYIRDEEAGDFWTATWQPVGKPLDQYKTECRHGLGYSVFETEYSGIRSEMRVFVPVDKPLEIWEVVLTNKSDRTRQLSLFPYAEFCFWHIDQDQINFQYILYVCNMGYEDGVVDYSTKLWEPREHLKGYLASTLPVVSFDTDRDVFLGQYRHEGQPKAVERGECFGSIAVGGTPCGAMQSRVTLAPGESIRACYVCGIGNAKTEGRRNKELYSDPAEVEREFEAVRSYWNDKLGRYACETPSAVVDSMVNIWNQYQCMTTFNWSRSASFNEAGGRDGMGFRDSNQDTLGAVHMVPERTRAKLLDLLRAQFADGSAMHAVQPLEWKQGPHNREEGGTFSDDHLWLLLSIPHYIRETGDFGILDESVEFADEGSGTVIEHLRRAVDFSWKHRGPNNLLLGMRADWNDCINLRGKGESMFSTFLFLKGLDELILLSSRRHEPTREHECMSQEMREEVAARAWDGEWFLRGFLDSGRKLGSHKSDGSTIFINSQSWAVVANVAPRPRLEQAMDSLHKHLATEHGIVINAPAYLKVDLEIGAITGYPPGLKENGGIFCHANTWAVVAEGILGRGRKAMDLYLSFLPAAKNEGAEVYTMEPYVYSQFITGKDHPYKFGRARNSWLTGTASWAFIAISQYMLGVRPDYDGLMVSPTIPAEWDGFKVTRKFRGATYEIEIRNPNHVESGVASMSVDGQRITGNLVPLAPEKATVRVVVEMG